LTAENTEKAEKADTKFSGIGEEVGARLAERRSELGHTLRQVAQTAEVSASHLSEIENGRTQVSIPVLLRLVKALDMTITELLPRIGGHHVTGGTIGEVAAGEQLTLSHAELELNIELCHLPPDGKHTIENPQLVDLLIHVLAGSAAATAAGQDIDLSTGDTMDCERVGRCELTTDEGAQVLIVLQSAQG
jgi:transcriptional regulator with XRE-family HTH domain